MLFKNKTKQKIYNKKQHKFKPTAKQTKVIKKIF